MTTNKKAQQKELTLSEKRERFFHIVDEKNENFKYKINALPMIQNATHDCEREQMVSYFQMAPLIQQTQGVKISEADYILYGHPIARVEDFTDDALKDMKRLDKQRKKGSELIIMGKATNIKPYIEGKYDNVTFVDSHYAEYLGKRFGFDFKEEYFVYDDEREQLNIWPVDGCLNKCAFCRRTFMNIPFESQPLDFIKEKLDWYKENHPEQMKTIVLRAENLTEYGIDIYGKQMLHKLIDLIDSYDEIENINILIGMCIGEITPEILDSLCKTKKLDFIGLNIEAGSDRLLKLIGKKHDKEKARYVYKTLYGAHPKLYTTCTVMIGLPTEELEDIFELGNLINELSPKSVLCNYYGHSPKNPLEKYPQLDDKVKEYHLKFLMKILKENNRRYLLKFSYEAPFKKNKRIDARIKRELDEIQKGSLPRILNRNIMYYCNDRITVNRRYYEDEINLDELVKRYKEKVKLMKDSKYSHKL